MKHISLTLIAWCLLISCSSLPKVYQLDRSASPDLYQKCSSPFLNGKWQFLHSIEGTMPGGKNGFFMGLTVISAADRSVRCVMMSIEGFVLFDAQYDDRLAIKRGLTPFDSENFAKGLMKDIRLIFFKPPGSLIKSGILKNGSFICRYRNHDSKIVDIITHSDHSWEIRQYTQDYFLFRTVKGYIANNDASTERTEIPDRIELTSHGSFGYKLMMNLVEAIPLSQ